jgi:hypothetical protein
MSMSSGDEGEELTKNYAKDANLWTEKYIPLLE